MSAIQQATQLSLLSPSPLVASPRVGSRVSYPVVSFFSGAGFLDLGLRRAGHKILWSCEYDPQICDTHDYAMEHYYRAEGLPGDVPYIECRRDIQKIKPSKVQKEAIGSLSKGEEFGVVGGPPCPDFSIGGKNRGGTGDHGRLTSVFVSMVCELGPLFFILENVKGLVNTRKHREFLSGEIHRLEEAGYAVDYKILNALDFGVPQDRERVFMVGFRKEAIRDLYEYIPPKSERAWFPWPHDPVYSGAKQKYDWPDTSPFGETPPCPSASRRNCSWLLSSWIRKRSRSSQTVRKASSRTARNSNGYRRATIPESPSSVSTDTDTVRQWPMEITKSTSIQHFLEGSGFERL
jgi:DNA (cytosine-5)-methyltransferase 1